jgi:hypothetical protein
MSDMWIVFRAPRGMTERPRTTLVMYQLYQLVEGLFRTKCMPGSVPAKCVPEELSIIDDTLTLTVACTHKLLGDPHEERLVSRRYTIRATISDVEIETK